MSDDIIATAPKGHNKQLRIHIGEYRGFTLIHVREWYRKDSSDGWRPGKGAAFNPDTLPVVLAALHEVERRLWRAEELLPEDYTNAGLEPPDLPDPTEEAA